jgi:hypothetical protein
VWTTFRKSCQTEQRCAVALRVAGAQTVGFVDIDAQRVDDVLRHALIDRREDRVRGVMQRVVEIEQPDRTAACDVRATASGSGGAHDGGRRSGAGNRFTQ